jgi:hypothetical protein
MCIGGNVARVKSTACRFSSNIEKMRTFEGFCDNIWVVLR